MMARSSKAPSMGRIQKRKTNFLQIVIFALQRAAGPYRWAENGNCETLVSNQSRRAPAIFVASTIHFGAFGEDRPPERTACAVLSRNDQIVGFQAAGTQR